MKMVTKIAFVEDNQIFRQALHLLISENKSFNLVGMFANAESLIHELPFIQPDIILMDINLPGINGIEAVERLRSLGTLAKIVMLTVHDDDENIFNSLKSGADGYLLKRDALENLSDNIRIVISEGALIAPEVANKILIYFRNIPNNSKKEFDILSEREMKVLLLIIEGMSNKEIADQIFLSVDSVKKTIQNIYSKMHVKNRSQMIKRYYDFKSAGR